VIRCFQTTKAASNCFLDLDFMLSVTAAQPILLVGG
jgi:hypothetical protein